MPSTEPDTNGMPVPTTLPDYSDYLHVAAAVIENAVGEILIARRPEHLHQGGLWEFPGGKVESGESVQGALHRELREELGIHVRQAVPLIRIPYDYTDRKVLLDIWRVTAFDNTAYGAEGQAIAWVAPQRLHDYTFPAANEPIVNAARLPYCYLITPEPGEPEHWPAFLSQLESVMSKGIRLIQLRTKQLDSEQYRRLAREVVALGRIHDAQVLLNSAPECVEELGADGVHLSTSRLMALKQRPLSADRLVAASCHTLAELQHAMAIGSDFAVVSPVNTTASHPDAAAIGWTEFQRLTENSAIPVYALGGMREEDLSRAWASGGQGIAAIRALWQ